MRGQRCKPDGLHAPWAVVRRPGGWAHKARRSAGEAQGQSGTLYIRRGPAERNSVCQPNTGFPRTPGLAPLPSCPQRVHRAARSRPSNGCSASSVPVSGGQVVSREPAKRCCMRGPGRAGVERLVDVSAALPPPPSHRFPLLTCSCRGTARKRLIRPPLRQSVCWARGVLWDQDFFFVKYRP